MYHALGQALA